METPDSFIGQQKQFRRVAYAFSLKDTVLFDEFEQAKLTYPPQNLFIRAFKAEKELELWVKQSEDTTYQYFKTYPICKVPGKLGPKRVQGDSQVPEGIYHIDYFNPKSTYHLSLRINYPNASDKIRGDKDDPGDNIFIHGACLSVGCLPMTNDGIREIYCLAVHAHNHEQAEIPVHIFPFRPQHEEAKVLTDSTSTHPHKALWQELFPFHQYFNKHKKLPTFAISPEGAYKIQE